MFDWSKYKTLYNEPINFAPQIQMYPEEEKLFDVIESKYLDINCIHDKIQYKRFK